MYYLLLAEDHAYKDIIGFLFLLFSWKVHDYLQNLCVFNPLIV